MTIKKMLHRQHVYDTGNSFGIMQQNKAEEKTGVLEVQPQG